MNLKPRKLSMSIGMKTLVSHLMLTITILMLTVLLSYTFAYRYVRQTRIDDLAQKAQRIADSAHMVSDGGVIPSRRLVTTYQDLTDARVFFLNGDSDNIRITQFQSQPTEEHPEEYRWVEVLDAIDRQFAQRVLNGERVATLRHFEFVQDIIIFAGVPITSEDGTVLGGVILAQTAEMLHSFTRPMLVMLLAVAGVSLGLAILLSLEQTRLLVKPIQKITQAARRMADGTYAERITSLPNDEIGELGHALNSMSGRLVDVIRNLRKERDKLELIISNIGEGLIAVNWKWDIVHVNRAFLELMELDDVEDMSWMTVGDTQPLRDMFEECMRAGVSRSMEWTNPSGRALRMEASTLEDESGAILGTVCLVRDVSEAQRMEQLRRDYVANISHELRTPLTGIRGMVEPLIDGCMETEEERQECYQVILKETMRLQKLVGEMLDMSRLQDGRIHLELEPLELTGILEASARAMKQLADDAGVALRVETDGTTLSCLGNEDRISQVLVILIDNALSFTPRGGSVTIGARDEGDRVSVSVVDTGCGIEPKDLPFIWERFYKADKSRMRTTGTGLGLAIAKLVVELMGGEIGVESEPGRGARFTFTLNKE